MIGDDSGLRPARNASHSRRVGKIVHHHRRPLSSIERMRNKIDIPIIDTHMHIWDVARLRYPWLADVPALNRTYLPSDYRLDTEGLPIRKMVFVQCEADKAQYKEEVAWVSRQAETEPRIAAIIAWAPLEQGDGTRELLGDLCAKYPLVRGVRRLIQSEPDAGFCLEPDFVKGVRLLSDFDLHFEICIKGDEQFRNTLELVRQCPDVRFILDHIGKPYIKDKIMEPWAVYICELAAMPNTWCKISGLVNEADMEQWQPSDLRPYLDHVVQNFGFDRIMFGGDWPVITLASTYKRWIEILRDIIGECSDVEQRGLFYSNAEQFYRI